MTLTGLETELLQSHLDHNLLTTQLNCFLSKCVFLILDTLLPSVLPPQSHYPGCPNLESQHLGA